MGVGYCIDMISYNNIVTVYSENGVIWEGKAQYCVKKFPNYIVTCISAFKEGHIGLLVQEINQED